jgi:hypothetical protein
MMWEGRRPERHFERNSKCHSTSDYFGCATIRMYGFGDFQPCG